MQLTQDWNIEEKMQFLKSKLQNQGPAEGFEIRIVSGGVYPDELVTLRKKTFGGILDEQHLFDENDEVGKHILLYENGKLVGSTTMVDGEKSNFSKYSGFKPESLKNCYVGTRSSVDPTEERRGLFPLLMYLALSQNRDKEQMIFYCEEGEIPAKKILKYLEIEGAKSRDIDLPGGTYKVFPYEMRVADGLLRCWQKMSEESKGFVKTLFVEGIADQVQKGCEKYYSLEYYSRVSAHTLSKTEYINCLANAYDYVKYTTRVLGYAVGMCDDPELRRHYAGHLSGEVNHEIWIEEDLRYLGADTDYIKEVFVANSGIHMFRFIQESLCSFRRDPIVFLAVPIAIEGITAFMNEKFITDLKANIEHWGFEKPHKAVKFFSSHIHTDGAEEGHWVQTLRMLEKHVQNEKQMQEIKIIIDLVFDALTKSYNEHVLSSYSVNSQRVLN